MVMALEAQAWGLLCRRIVLKPMQRQRMMHRGMRYKRNPSRLGNPQLGRVVAAVTAPIMPELKRMRWVNGVALIPTVLGHRVARAAGAALVGRAQVRRALSKVL
jgi:hypothetical protein